VLFDKLRKGRVRHDSRSKDRAHRYSHQP
jgi:hypothetical protein